MHKRRVVKFEGNKGLIGQFEGHNQRLQRGESARSTFSRA